MPDSQPKMKRSGKPIRVAVIGGGCAALTTAFELSRPEHAGRYQVTVYQMGWRLGGKGASGRGIANRIEEHGLHLWMGFYENSFRLMRECYAERHNAFPNSRFASWRDAFEPAPDVGVADLTSDGWKFWLAHFPPGQGEPGDLETGDPFTVTAYLRQSVILIAELLRSAASMNSTARSTLDFMLKLGQLAGAAGLVEMSEILRQSVDSILAPMFQTDTSSLTQLFESLSGLARRQLDYLVESDGELRRIWQVIDLILAVIRGSLRAGLAFDPRGFDAINEFDWRDWLRMNGASEPSLNSGFMRGIYDLAFAFQDGDVNRPQLAAGVALRGAMRMFFTYRGALFWRMNGGMGDIVFAPLYQVLKERGVRFEFFHRLQNVRLSRRQAGQPSFVRSLEFDVQARIKGGEEYQPLVEVNNLASWTSKPDYEQLVHGGKFERESRDFESAWDRGREGTRTLRVIRDFDFVVLGVSIGALPAVAGELIERAPLWRDMVRHVKTVPTQAFQIWMRKSCRELGWMHPPMSLSGFVEPFDTWADMSHLIPEESWTNPVKSIAYFCSVLPDAVTDGAAEKVRANAIRFLDKHVGNLWSKATRSNGGFRWDLLAVEGKGKSGPDRFDTQYWAANINPTDRYVQSLPGSIMYRVSPLDMTFDNLTIAGDWTATGLDSGCIESAVMSGLLASHAISQRPLLHEIIGYDHP